MKTLILYAGKHGATFTIAQRLADRMPGSLVCNLKDGAIPSLADFDCIVVGCALYAGMISKEAKAFLAQNEGALCQKKVGLFLSGLDPSREKECLEGNFSKNLLNAATAKAFLGGIFDPKKAGVMGRLIIKMITKQSAYVDNISDDKIEQFAEALKA